MARSRKKSPPPTVSRAALLSRGSDAEFRGLIHDLIAYGHKLDACRDAFAAIAGVSGVQYEILMLVSRAEGLSIGEVAERLMIRHHTAVELVNRLESNDFVSRIKDREDARRVYVKPTAKAERLMEGLASAHLLELKGIRPVLQQLLDQFESPPVASGNRPGREAGSPTQRARRTND